MTDVEKIVKVLKEIEGALSDGYEHYCGSWGIDDQLEFVAKTILDGLKC